MSVYSVQDIADKINARAFSEAPRLLPNGHFSDGKTRWVCSGIADTGKSSSMTVWLTGDRQGRWRDYGNAAAGEDRGDMLDLIRLKEGLARPADAVQRAKEILGLPDEFRPGQVQQIAPEERARRAEEARARAEERHNREAAARALKVKRARGLWLAGEPIAGTPAEAYLRGRGLRAVAEREGAAARWPGSLHFHAEVWNHDAGVKLPCMVSAIFDAAGQQMGTHRIYLEQDAAGRWGKFRGGEAKKVLGTFWGGFVPIAKGSSGKSMRDMPAGEAVYVTEGIEDALVVRMIKPEARVVAAVSLSNIGAIVLPPAARELVIVADRDSSSAAQEQLERVLAAQQARGLAVRLVMPPVGCKDMNDWLNALTAQRAGGQDRQAGYAA